MYAQFSTASAPISVALLASVSIASIVIGLAAQSTLGNLIAGFALLLYRPFRVGDQVQLMTSPGSDDRQDRDDPAGIYLLRDVEGNQVIVPNSIIANVVLIRIQPPSDT